MDWSTGALWKRDSNWQPSWKAGGTVGDQTSCSEHMCSPLNTNEYE